MTSASLFSDRLKAAVLAVGRELQTEVLLTAWRVGLYVPPDRHLLDTVIMPYFAAKPGCQRLLFVGVKAYNAHHRALFVVNDGGSEGGRGGASNRGKAYVTLDPDPASKAFGSERHHQAYLEDLLTWEAPGSFDAIVVNGVIGHGLDDPQAVERSLNACHEALRPGGELLLGINEERPTTVNVWPLPSFQRFREQPANPFGRSVHRISTPLREKSHTFVFLEKPNEA